VLIRRLPVVLIAAVVGTSLVALGASAGPRPVTTTYYFHGGPNGNLAAVQAAAAGVGSHLPMDAARPTSATSADYGFGSVAGNPSSQCLGDPQSMVPTWTGKASGTLVKKVVLSVYTRSIPVGRIKVNLFKDVPNMPLCGASYPKPVASASGNLPESVDAPMGPPYPFERAPVTLTLVLPKPVVVKGSFTVQIQPAPDLVPFQGSSIIFDGASAPSGVTWTCVPNKGRKAC